jgi:large subunit ribosomal protein L9
VKVIFIEDVTNVARAGQTKEVADGFARNFLFPRKLALLANSQAAAAVETHLKKIVKQRALEEAEMAELAKMINGREITLKAKVGEKEKLYGSVTGADIAEALSKDINREIDKRKVDLTEPIRQVGIYDVIIRFTHEITAVVNVTVMSDEEGAERPVKVEKKVEKAEEKTEEKKEKVEKKEKKARKEKPPKEEKEGKPVTAEKEEKPVKEEKAEKPAKEKKAKPAKAETEEKPPKEKKAKAEKAEKEDKPEKEEKPAREETKEKKPRAKKAKKTEAKTEDVEAKEEKKETE